MELSLSSNVQSKYLEKVKDLQTPVIIFTTNGFQIRGIIKDFDDFSILIESEGREQLVYKHAVSTVAPPYQEQDSKRNAWR